KSGISKVMLRGFKSIRDMHLELRPLNILIGSNGSGKTNFMSFFRMLSSLSVSSTYFRAFIEQEGGASSLLYRGVKNTQEITATLSTIKQGVAIDFDINFRHVPDDQFALNSQIFAPESELESFRKKIAQKYHDLSSELILQMARLNYLSEQ